MFKSLSFGLLIAGACSIAPASAAEPAGPVPRNAADSAPSQGAAGSPFNWAGFYAGATVGSRRSNNDWTTSAVTPSVPGVYSGQQINSSFNATATRVSALLGHSWRLGARGLVGIEADYGSGSRGATRDVPGSDITQGATHLTANLPAGTVREGWDAGLRLRAGYLATPDTLLYGSGGYAWQKITIGASCAVSTFCSIAHDETYSTVRTGWTLGLGLEQRFMGNWIARLDYRYAYFGGIQHTFFSDGLIPVARDDRFTANVTTRTNTFNVGLVYKF